jgi:hypothetical protein
MRRSSYPPTKHSQSKTGSVKSIRPESVNQPRDHSNSSPAQPQQPLRRSQRRAPPAPSSRHTVQASTPAPKSPPTFTPTARRSTATRGKSTKTNSSVQFSIVQLKNLYQCCTLEVPCNPYKAMKTKASWRAPAKYFKAYIRRRKTYKSEYFSNLFHTILLNFMYLLLTYHPPPLPDTMSNPQHPSRSHISTPASQEIEMEDATASNKRTTLDPENTLQKKAKANYTSVSTARDPSKTKFWYGFPAMEAIAYEGGVPPIIVNTPLAELVTSGFWFHRTRSDRPEDRKNALPTRPAKAVANLAFRQN